MSASSSASWARSFSICLTAWITVVWSRPPKRRPISGRERGVSCLERYIATCRGRATSRARRAVRADHEAPAGRDDLVHRVEEFFLGRFLAGDELDVVDHQQVGGAQLLLELEGLVGAERGEELDGELLRRHVDDLRARPLAV